MTSGIDLLGTDRQGPFRGNLHCHSVLSDGRESLEDLCHSYRQAGYDFLVVSDHFEAEYGWRVSDTRHLTSSSFVTLLGAELSSGDWHDRSTYWVVAAGMPLDFSGPRDGETGRELIRRAHDLGAYVVLLHPGLNNLPSNAIESEELEAIDAIEIFNYTMANTWPDQAYGAYFFDSTLERGTRVHVNAGDGAECDHAKDRFGAWIEVYADSLRAEDLLASLKEGFHYATQGPRIEQLFNDSGDLHVVTSPAYSIVLAGTGDRWLNASQRFAGSCAITEATFSLAPFAGSFCRIAVVDDDGKRAWSNPIWP
jgi:hypothetical protein